MFDDTLDLIRFPQLEIRVSIDRADCRYHTWWRRKVRHAAYNCDCAEIYFGSFILRSEQIGISLGPLNQMSVEHQIR